MSEVQLMIKCYVVQCVKLEKKVKSYGCKWFILWEGSIMPNC